eukprot:CAMPEP_0197040416 /NCGR_PEP_ID=MMETSP1384-20130603/17115_1 /TAXON_ID=29189 /ORGANISM="Ammonia sp." /LENGTH=129 /DNA_ID=CAMNT_0042471165 /DNA_START=130 /DNA_END=519 /DNA_ORIENTATION=-
MSATPSGSDQIEQLNEEQRNRGFTFKDAPNNRQLVLGTFDHVSDILSAVHSPLATPVEKDTPREPNCNICVEKVLKPSTLKRSRQRRHSRARSSLKQSLSLKAPPLQCTAKTTYSYAHCIAAQLTPMEP